ncbi:hypothetical protein SAMN04515668_2572 [Hymenobacter arizonensis]|uniref:Uncharacterized protein n=1 Tax=Hymenobacter arizonensis TaxID=1227077 RepID=A0A1I5YZS9_HYMAR|nr:hypothetical protein SAMN04515668_2572 [Hymenobacter arizonensis]
MCQKVMLPVGIKRFLGLTYHEETSNVKWISSPDG